MSGEIIPLSASMTMMFEVEDLAVASPATVSRVGVVYMQPASLGHGPLLDSWLERLPADAKPYTHLLRILLEELLPGALLLVRRCLVEPVPTTDQALVAGCLGLLDALLRPHFGE